MQLAACINPQVRQHHRTAATHRAHLQIHDAAGVAIKEACPADYAGLDTLNIPWRMLASDTPIQPLIIGDNAAAMQFSARLEAQGMRVPAIRQLTVPKG